MSKAKIPEFRVRPDVTRWQLRRAGFEENGDHWTYQQFLYEKFVYVKILISKEDLFITTKIMRADDNGFYSPFYNRIWGPKNLIVEKADERYLRLLRRLERADVIEFIKEKTV